MKLNTIKLAQQHLTEMAPPGWMVIDLDADRGGYWLVASPFKEVYARLRFESTGNIEINLDHPAYGPGRYPKTKIHIGDPTMSQRIFDLISEAEK